MLNYIVFKKADNSYGYKVESADGTFNVLQEYVPGEPDKQPMTEEQAHFYAQELIALNS